ncbi:DUF945 family protein [Pelagibaculum spongiae]|uniref:DUF945 domain-containing protein n=1 Tax=Pelagibaculum spongiae TaxID=2080658 RepID=A0A2V1H486_9GAMM|nr:DUF945 family protein [Pelagibaculum spongiae]PVZ72038.1 hypothetical protein DC094_03180 [Pelagibaculum spongiae]
MKKVIGGLLAVGVLAGAAPFVAGMQIEKQYTQINQLDAAKYGIDVKLVDYQRGYSSSTVKLQLDLSKADPQFKKLAQPAGANEQGEMIVEFEGQVYHGPVIFSEQGISTGLSRAVIYPVWNDELQQKALKPIFGEKAPLTFTVDLGLDQSIRAELAVPSVTFDAPAWQAIVAADDRASGEIPFLFNSDPISIVVESNKDFSEMTSRASFPKIEFSAEASEHDIEQKAHKFSLQGLTLKQSQHRLDPTNADSIWLGDVSYVMDAMHLEQNSPYVASQNIDLQGFNMKSAFLKENATDLKLSLSGDVKSATMAPLPSVGPLKIDSSISKINSKLTQELATAIQDAINVNNGKAQPDIQKLNGILLTKLPEFFSNLQLDISELSLMTSTGQIDASAQVLVPKITPAMAFNKQQLIKAFEASLNIAIPKALGDMPPASQVLSQLGQFGVETLAGEQYKVDANFKDGALKVNGVDLPFPG